VPQSVLRGESACAEEASMQCGERVRRQCGAALALGAWHFMHGVWGADEDNIIKAPALGAWPCRSPLASAPMRSSAVAAGSPSPP
jgi:hypothetical protein